VALAAQQKGIDMKNRASLIISILGVLMFSGQVFAADACLLSPEELSTATGREFSAGEARKDIATGEPQCFYAQKANPKRGVLLRIQSEKAAKRFEATKRVTTFGSEPVDVPGVGDAAYFNGTSAGVLAGQQAVILSLRGAGDPKIAREKVADLLKLIVARLK
jgi:hypothetical protein